MKIEQIYTGCLAQGAYFISSEGEAAVVDPLREVQPYIDRAEKEGVKIKYIFETHFHADFVSGHKDLAEKTGATIVFGPTEMPIGFEAYIAKDGEEFRVGEVRFEALHTPGHTMESTTFLLKDKNDNPNAIFTGDTLFIGDVGRPDLAQKLVQDLTQDKLARHLYHSLRNKIMPLPNNVMVYPAHGAGSACGKKMSKETFDTLGNQKKVNYALQEMSEDEFVNQVTEGLTPPPAYFPENVMMNVQGYENIDTVIKSGLAPLSAEEFEQIANTSEALIIDTRNAKEFVKAFIPNSIFIGIDGGFAPWVGTLVEDIKQPILIVAEPGREEEVITRLSRVGYDNSIGYLDGGFQAWEKAGKATDNIPSINPEQAFELYKEEDYSIADVRKKSEYDSEHVEGALNAPLDYINESMRLLDKDDTFLIHCAGGYRSVIFISILKARGFVNLINIEGGFKEIKEKGQFPLTAYVCPSTLL